MNFALITTFLTGCGYRAIKTPDPESPSMTPTPITETFTPFQPEDFISFNSTETPIPTITPEKPIPYKMFGIDFADPGQKIDIKINLSTGNVFDINSTPAVCETTNPYNSTFLPGKGVTCEYQLRNNPEDMVHFTHSGWFHEPKKNGGINYIKLEAEDIRHYLEDATDYQDDKQRLTLAQIQERMADFLNATVSISQGDITTEGLKVLAITRIPPDKLGPFAQGSGLTNEDIVSTLAFENPAFAGFATDGKPQIVIIFCGWHSPEDNPIKGSTPGFYEWSRYAIVLGK